MKASTRAPRKRKIRRRLASRAIDLSSSTLSSWPANGDVRGLMFILYGDAVRR